MELAISIASAPNHWVKAHDVFSALRRETLQLERLRALSPAQALLLKNLLLAELVAKVIYNSANPADEFDDDSGWWVAPCLKDILDLLDDAKFAADPVQLSTCKRRRTTAGSSLLIRLTH